MRQVLLILFGAAFTVAVSVALGRVLLRKLRVSLYREEAALFAFLAGAALLSTATFFLSVVGLARWWVFLPGGVGAVVWAVERRREKGPGPLPDGRGSERCLFYLILGVFFVIYFVNAMAPEVSPDGSGYHLGNVARMWRRHGFVWDYHSMYAYLSQGLEMLFLVAYSFGRHSSAALVHFAFVVTLALLMMCYGRRFRFPRAGLFAAVLVAASPIVGKAGSSGYNDLAVSALLFAIFYLLQVWDDNQESNLLIIVGLLSGFGYAVKYTAGIGFVFALGFVWAKSKQRIRHLWIVGAAAGIGFVPWMVRNWIWVGNPLAPFANRWFTSPYFHPGSEAAYLADLGHYPGIQHWWDVPWQLLVRGRATAGLLGPVFFLAPLALLALRRRAGRNLLLAAAIFAIPAYFNTGSRFMIPALPFVSLAMGLAGEGVPAALVGIGVLHGIAGWPAVTARYADFTAWRVTSIPVAAALRREPETKYLTEHLKDYSMKAALETLTPPGAKIYSVDSVAEAYLDRTIVVGYESALGNLGTELMATPLDRTIRPEQRQRFRLLPVKTRAVRVVETASAPGYWTISELHTKRQGRELPRAAGWRVKAWPNGWDAALAFDNSYATRWSSWQDRSFGAFVAVDFGRPEVIDEVVIDHAAAAGSKAQVEALDARGHWIPLTDTSEALVLDTPPGLRRAATLALKARGLGYLLVRDSDFFAGDLQRNASYWGVTELWRGERVSLYVIQ